MSLRIGFIGVGGIASLHIESLKRIDEAEIVSVYDVSPENAANAAERTGAQVMDSAEDVLDPGRIDAVYICTPQFARGNLEELAAKRGIHLFVEKPLGLNVEEVLQKEKAILESGIIHSVGYCLRYLDTVQQAKAYLNGRQAHLIQAYRFGGSHPARWWHQLDMSGGHLVDAVTHQVDMIRYLAGEFQEIEAKFGRVSFDRQQAQGTIYDAGAITFSMEGGTIGSITESCLSVHHSSSDVKLFGPDFFVHLSNNGFTLTIVDENQNETVTSAVEPYFEQSKAFIDAIIRHTQEPVLSSYSDAARTLAVTLAANRSSVEHTALQL
ncbi:Gfo/Idh/MocA family protein [Paenibacillus spongiae]|uniref:Gfo/Idh/MocA family oxidoreductase n=1 Tax=Paenibacillus spongiae TaxID=2909671 RepID=A0ABY5S6T4_9BACL|nr:Gfo/Idh/MocA family oxidoreductase [Paenibacillus spongiae]UVI28540.1 Gfo/Idh/MocA family oxidoreductase [Paenibacillus spongiae]